MACERWTEKLDAYVDGELSAGEARTLDEHLRGCSGCAAQTLRKVQQKRAIQAAGQRFKPDPAFRARIQRSIAAAKPTLWSRRRPDQYREASVTWNKHLCPRGDGLGIRKRKT
jgi:anti-sigma factor RsiW